MTRRYSNEAKSGYVYVGNSTRRDGSVKQYTGSTTRTVRIREREHKREVAKGNSRTWTGKGTDFKVTGYFKSKNPRRDEKKLKGMTKSERNKFISKKIKSSTTKKRKKTPTRRTSASKYVPKRRTTKTKASSKKSTSSRPTRRKSSYSRRYRRR